MITALIVAFITGMAFGVLLTGFIQSILEKTID